MEYIVSAATDVGTTKQTNQDSFGVKVMSTCIGNVVVAVMCDGMGGYEKGEVASATVVDAFNKWMLSCFPTLCMNALTENTIVNEWRMIAYECNDRINKYGRDNGGISIGTTVTAMLITESRYVIMNVGDSRAYEINKTTGLMTRDQTVVARDIELGLITEEEAKTDRRRSILLQCIGAGDSVEPEFFVGNTKKNAVYILCSDGFRHEITPEEMKSYLDPNTLNNPDIISNNLKVLIEINKQRNETDNISVIAIKTY